MNEKTSESFELYGHVVQSPEDLPTLEEVGKHYRDVVLRIVHGNKSRAARILGVDRRTLYRQIDRSKP